VVSIFYVRASPKKNEFTFEGEELERRFEWFPALYRTKSGSLIIQVHDDWRVTITDTVDNSNSSYTSEGKLDSCFKVGSEKEKQEALRTAKQREEEVARLLQHPVVKADMKK
jgi:hypothetical protein